MCTLIALMRDLREATATLLKHTLYKLIIGKTSMEMKIEWEKRGKSQMKTANHNQFALLHLKSQSKRNETNRIKNPPLLMSKPIHNGLGTYLFTMQTM